MTGFTRLEEAALRSIFLETPDIADGLERQLERAWVIKRENSGVGFFTDIAVAEDAGRVTSPKVLGYETFARVAGMEYDLGFVLFMKDGKLQLLEGWALAGGTASLYLTDLAFEIYRAPVTGIP